MNSCMKLFELKSTRDWKWESMGANQVIASFATEPHQDQSPIEYFVEFTKHNLAKLLRRDPQTLQKMEDLGISSTWEVVFYHRGDLGYRETSISQTGGKMQTFATVIEIINSFLQNVDPQSFAFSGDASEKSRIKLYSRSAKIFERQG